MVCSNILIGDDGFATAVVDYLKEYRRVPTDVATHNVSTGTREVLFDVILAEKKPEKIIIIDTLDCSGNRESFSVCPLKIFPQRKIHDF